VNPADRVALVERMARARAWNLAQGQRDHYLAEAQADLAEIETSDVQIRRIGWMLIEPSDTPEGAEP